MMNHGRIHRKRDMFPRERCLKASIVNVISNRLCFIYFFSFILLFVYVKNNNKIYECTAVFNEYPVHAYVRFSIQYIMIMYNILCAYLRKIKRNIAIADGDRCTCYFSFLTVKYLPIIFNHTLFFKKKNNNIIILH